MDFSSFTLSELAVLRAALCNGKFYEDATATRLYVRVQAEYQARARFEALAAADQAQLQLEP